MIGVCSSSVNTFPSMSIDIKHVSINDAGDVKVFDFGLVKSLSPQLKAGSGGYGYRLTGRAGSIPYSYVNDSL